MAREIGPWRFIMNCLYAAKKPIDLDEGFWKYTSIAADEIKRNLSDIKIVNDWRTLDYTRWHNQIFFKTDKVTKTIEADRAKIKEQHGEAFLEEIVNYGFDEDIKKALPGIMQEAYRKFIESN